MPTALELKRSGWQPYIEKARARAIQIAPQHTSTQEQARLLKRVREAVDRLKKAHSVQRLILFGSLAHAGWSALDSDVDIAVEGLSDADFWAAWALLEEAIGRPVDLIEMETAPKTLLEAIRRHGIEL